MSNKSWALAAARLVLSFSEFCALSPTVTRGGGFTNTVRVCSLSGTPGAATSDTILIIVGGADLVVDEAEGVSDVEGFDSVGAGSETGGSGFTTNGASLAVYEA